jgi:hypothetical protein
VRWWRCYTSMKLAATMAEFNVASAMRVRESEGEAK